jgi:predicted dinucleotide-binding enzyme
MSNIAVIGSGSVGETLANGFLKHGYTTMRASREPAKLADWKAKAKGSASTGTLAEAAKWAEIIVLAVKGSAAVEAIDQLGAANIAGKVIIDATNPIADKPPVNGVIQFFTDLNESLVEKLQKRAPGAKLVKAFSCVGAAHMIDPKFATKPTMFICGTDAGAKAQVTTILDKFGWETADMGAVEAGRAIEPLCMLWCIPGLTRGQWSHAFKLIKQA